MTKKLWIDDILIQFGVKAATVQLVKTKGVWIIDDKYILKQARGVNIIKSAELAEKLLATGILVSAYLKTVTGEYICEAAGKQYCLMTKLSGGHIDAFDKNPNEVGRKLGSIIADLDNALKDIIISNPQNINFENELHAWIVPEIESARIKFDDGVIPACYTWLPIYRRLPRQLIHRDLHTDNMLFSGDEFAGFIDFDMSQINARIFDICYFGCTLLVDEYWDESQCLKWRNIFSAALNEYAKRCQLTDDEFAAMPMMFVIIEILFTAFYCKIKEPDKAQSCAKFAGWLYQNQAMLKTVCGNK